MDATTQLIVVLVIVTVAAVIIGRSAWRSWHGKRNGCGCSSCPATKPPR